MNEIQQKVHISAERFGIEVKDVRIIRADLPRENSEAIFRRMESERVQEAKQIRAEGDEKAQVIRAEAEKDRTIIIAEARKISDILVGEGEAEATKTYADAYNKDPKFYKIYRSFIAYRKAMKAGDTTLVIDPKQSSFLNHFTPLNK